MRVLVILPGEAFRNKETGFSDQKRASESQVRFFRRFPSITFDVFLNVYAHPALETLKSWYPNCVRCTVHQSLLGEHVLASNTIAQLRTMDLRPYSSILILRVDLFLRDFFSTVYNPSDDRILYTHLDANEASGGGGLHPGVCHHIVHVPPAFYPLLLEEKVWRHHRSLSIAAQYTSKLGLYSNTYHLCNSAMGWNPFYVIVGRDESKAYPHEGFRYDIQTRKKTYNAGDRSLRIDLETNAGT
jgi:hypothetical protein